MRPFIPREWIRMRKQPHSGTTVEWVDNIIVGANAPNQSGYAMVRNGVVESEAIKPPYSPGEVCWVREAIYYNVQHDNFYYVSNHKGCGDAVYHKLRKNVACRQTLKYSPAVMPEIAARRHVRILSCVPEQRGEWGWKIEWEESDAL